MKKNKSKTIYVASHTRHIPKWKKLRSEGWPIISSWLDYPSNSSPDSKSKLWSKCIEEASLADFLLFYAEEGDRLRGALVEMGAALSAGKRVFWVGEDQPSATKHPLVTICSSLSQALKLIKKEMKQKQAIVSKDLNYRINLCIGDRNIDGHEQQADYLILSNLSGKELQKAFRLGVKKLKCDITKHCQELEDNELTYEVLKVFLNLGLDFKIDKKPKKKYEIEPETFVKCYLLTAEAGNSDFEFQFEKQEVENIFIGGYGLFTF